MASSTVLLVRNVRLSARLYAW